MARDRKFILDVHCELNFVSASEVDRRVPYERYRRQWLECGQPEGFLAAVAASLDDRRTLRDVVEDADGDAVAYLWVTFVDVPGYDLVVAELNDLWVAPARRRQGIGRCLMAYVARDAQGEGAHRLRSGSGAGNGPSLRLHESAGFMPYRVQFEQPLGARPTPER